MRRDRKNDRHPTTTGLSLFFATIVAGLATAGATLGTPGGAMDIALAGPPARA